MKYIIPPMLFLLILIIAGCKKDEAEESLNPNISPEISLNQFGTIYIVRQDTLEVLATASDKDGKIKKVDFFIDEDLIASDNTEPYFIKWCADKNPGEYYLSAIAYDDDDALTSSKATLVKIDAGSLPSFSIGTGSHENFVVGSDVTIGCMAYDYDGVITRTELFVNDAKVFTVDTNHFEYTIEQPEIGSYTYYARAFDNSGNSNVSQEKFFNVNPNEPPTVYWDIYGNLDHMYKDMHLNLEATAFDPDGYINYVKLYLNDSLIFTDSAYNSYHYTYYDIDDLPAGNLSFKAVAYDSHGDSAVSEDFDVYVENRIEMEGAVINMLGSKDADKMYALIKEPNTLLTIDPYQEKILKTQETPFTLPLDMDYSASDDKIYIVSTYSGSVSVYDCNLESFYEIAFSPTADGSEIEVDETNRRIYVLATDGMYFIDMDLEEVVFHQADFDGSKIEHSNETKSLFAIRPGTNRYYLLKYSTSNDQLSLTQEIEYEAYQAGLIRAQPGGEQVFSLKYGSSSKTVYALDIHNILNILGSWKVSAPFIRYGTYNKTGTKVIFNSGEDDYLSIFHAENYQLSETIYCPYIEDYSVFETNASDEIILAFTSYSLEHQKYLYFLKP